MTQQRRRLTDLYVIGVEVTFEEDGQEPLTVFVRKLNPVEHEKALKAANAARARTMAVKNNPDSDEYAEIQDDVASYSREMLISYLLEEERNKKLRLVEAELAAEEEWDKDDYLTGLQQAWIEGGLKDEYARNPEDPEALSVFTALKRFNDAVEEEVAARVADLEQDLNAKPLDALQNQVFERFLSLQASMAWLAEYRRSEVFFATRELDKKTLYFVDRDEVDQLPDTVLARLSEEYQKLAVDPTEGKDSRVTDTSSPSSAPPESSDTAPACGPQESPQ